MDSRRSSLSVAGLAPAVQTETAVAEHVIPYGFGRSVLDVEACVPFEHVCRVRNRGGQGAAHIPGQEPHVGHETMACIGALSGELFEAGQQVRASNIRSDSAQ
jgi:hypothetical protein